MNKLILFASLAWSVNSLFAAAIAEEIRVGPEGSVAKSSVPGYLRIDSGRERRQEYLVRVDNILYVRSGERNDNTASTIIKLKGGSNDQDVVTFLIPVRVQTYENIVKALAEAR